MLGIDPLRQRDMQDEALGVIRRLLRGEAVTHETDWFKLVNAEIPILPRQENMPMAVASSISPSGMKLAGKYGIGVLSIASNSSEGLAALPTQWSFAEESASQHSATGGRADRSQWRVLMSWHLAETKKQAHAEAVEGLQRWNNDYAVRVLGRPNSVHIEDKWALLHATDSVTSNGLSSAVIGTPDEMVAGIRQMIESTGGCGTILGFAHDWANPENTRRSWDLFARYVIPEINSYTASMKRSADRVSDNKERLVAGAGAAIVAQIKRDPKASDAFAITLQQGQRLGAGASAAASAALAANKPE
jgi:limonene 1,2-monooxygenase